MPSLPSGAQLLGKALSNFRRATSSPVQTRSGAHGSACKLLSPSGTKAFVEKGRGVCPVGGGGGGPAHGVIQRPTRCSVLPKEPDVFAAEFSAFSFRSGRTLPGYFLFRPPAVPTKVSAARHCPAQPGGVGSPAPFGGPGPPGEASTSNPALGLGVSAPARASREPFPAGTCELCVFG